MGWLHPNRMAVSNSSMDPNPSSSALYRIHQVGDEQAVYNESGAVGSNNGSLSQLSRRSRRPAFTIAGSVTMVLTTSTSGMMGTGLKKCIPRKRGPRFVTLNISVIAERGGIAGKDGVRFYQGVKLLENFLLLVEIFNDRLDDQIAVGEILQRQGPLQPGLRLFFQLPASAFLFSPTGLGNSRFGPAPYPGLLGRPPAPEVRNPAMAEICAIPEPICPQPTTPTFLISKMFLPEQQHPELLR